MADQHAPNFALAFGKALLAKGKTNAELARALEISQVYVGDMRRGERRPPIDLIDRIADALLLAQWEREILHRAAAVDHGYKLGAMT